MPTIKIIRYVAHIIVLILLCWAFLRYIERRSIFFPMKNVDLTPQHMGLYFEDVDFRTQDGIELHGWFIPTEEMQPTILFCHGNAGNISHRIEIINIFNKIGLNVFIFDYRGYGKSKGSPSEKGTYLDAMASYNYLLKRGIDEDSIIIYGKSLGGAVAIDLARKVKHRALIVESVFTSVKDMAKEIYPFLPIRFTLSTRYDSISKIPNIATPKLVIHSQDDEIIPYSHGTRLFEAAKMPKEFFKMRGGHNDAVLLSPDEFKEGIESFLAKYKVL